MTDLTPVDRPLDPTAELARLSEASGDPDRLPLVPTPSGDPVTADKLSLATGQRDDARRIVEEARLEAAALLHMEREHNGHGRDGHLNEDDLAPLLTALQITPADPMGASEAPTWEDVWAAIGREVWKLAPQDYQDSGHRDLTFLVCWQNIMEAVDNGILAVAALPDEVDR